MEEMTRIVLADDHATVRAGIRKLLERHKDILVVGEASNGKDAISLVEQLAPDLLLLDMEMPGMNGGQVASYLKQKRSGVKVLAISAYDDIQYINGMLENGAAGYLTKEEVPDNLVLAIRKIINGESGWISQRAANQISRSKQ